MATLISKGFRSGLEDANAAFLQGLGCDALYEQHKLEYLKPARKAKYTPDFILPNGIIIETKGRFLTEDRHKHLLIKDQYPKLDIRFVFSRSKTAISKTSRTTYAMWCEKNGFEFADKLIPLRWVQEHPGEIRCQAAMDILDWRPPAIF